MALVKLSKRESNLILITLGVGVFYLFYQFILLPKLDEIGSLAAKTVKLRLDVKVMETKIKILAAVEKRYGELPEEVKPTVAPTEAKALEVLRSLSETTSQSALKLIAIKPLVDEKTATMKFELVCAGDFQQLYKFLEILHNLPVLILVDSLNVTGNKEAGGALDIKMSLTAHY